MLRAKKRRIQRIGVIGTGRIAGRFMSEARSVSGVEVQSVYNPHPVSALKFAEQWDLDAYRDIEDFYNNVDAVYIASPHETHYGYIKTALEHGKNVICEKPMVLKKSEAEEVYGYAKEHGLILYEGIKTAYCPGFHKLLGVAFSGRIGAIRNIEACFTKLENPQTRELTDLKYGGSFLELGSYVLLPVMKIFGTDYARINFEVIHGENGLDLFTKANLRYPNGIATVTVGLGVKAEGRLLISGTNGYIVVGAPWWKTSYFEVHYEDPNKVEKYTEPFLDFGLRYEISDFLSKLSANGEEDFKLTREESIAMAGIMEKFMDEERRMDGMDTNIQGK